MVPKTNASPSAPVAKIVFNDPDDRDGKFRRLGGSKSDKWNRHVADQAFDSLWNGHGDVEKMGEHANAVASALVGINPENELEGMLAAQLIAAHNASMECHRRAMLPKQSFEGRQSALNQANKLSRSFCALLDTFHRQRCKVHQKVVVEHVHVHEGGQAVVGVVNGAGGGSPPKLEEQPYAKQLADASQSTLRCEDALGEALQIPCNGERPV